MKYASACLLLAAAIAWSAPVALSASGVGEDGISVAPSTLLLGGAQGGTVTVHTNIKASLVSGYAWTLNGVASSGLGVDSQGCIVISFNELAVEATVAPPAATMTLKGVKPGADDIVRTDTVSVVAFAAPRPGR